jgi:dynein heavy chain
MPDFTISWSQLKIFLNDYESVPWDALKYMAAEANYGGRVTDPMDRRLITTILKTFYTPEILKDDYRLSESGVYFAPPSGPLSSYIEYIGNLPINDETDIFGMHANAAISSEII